MMSRRSARLLLFVAALCACSSDSDEPPRLTSFAVIEPNLSLVIESKVGKVVTKEIAVSGRDRLEVPETRNWTCGNPLQGLVTSNVAWFELANPSADTLSVTLKLDGLEKTHPRMFVYASKNAPLKDCLTFSGQRSLAGTSSVVVDPTSSAAVLLATGAATGVYKLVLETEHVISP